LRPRVLSTSEAASEIGISERTLRRYISDGLIGYRRLPGGHYRIPAEAIDEFWERHAPPSRRSGRQLLVARPRPRDSERSKSASGKRRPRLGASREPRPFDIPPPPSASASERDGQRDTQRT